MLDSPKFPLYPGANGIFRVDTVSSAMYLVWARASLPRLLLKHGVMRGLERNSMEVKVVRDGSSMVDHVATLDPTTLISALGRRGGMCPSRHHPRPSAVRHVRYIAANFPFGFRLLLVSRARRGRIPLEVGNSGK